MFNDIINKKLISLGKHPVEGIRYEQYYIVEKKGYFYIFESNKKIIGSSNSLTKAKELINTIISGC